MKRLLLTLLLAAGCTAIMRAQQTEVTTQEAKNLYKNTTKRRVSVHDPSVVYEPSTKCYYIFGSHRGCAYTTDMQNWTGASFTWKAGTNTNAGNDAAFVTPVVKTVKKGGAEVALPAFNAMAWSAKGSSDYNINGNMWAPDVVWNPTMKKWCMYLSINGDNWYSSIILLTSDKITGPYEYQGPVVISGFYSGTSYKDTDLELVLGTQSSLPSRYNVGSNWGRRWPNNIDPAVFFDEEGQLWLVYGSWSGGIWMLELDETTGLRDYDVTYPVTGSGDGVTSDPYFGTKVAGGYYVSGEGPYIEHIGQYYYLFVSYGFYSPDGGYEMRVFRSDKPNGPYKDAAGRPAVYSSYVMNYGTGSSDMRGEKIMGAYGEWGFMGTGECAQGHNSIIAAEDGRTYLVYHTKFNDGQPERGYHAVRTHQVFVNKQGWLVAAPFEYNGEMVTDADIAKASLTAQTIPGDYQLLVHKYRMDYAKMEEVKPVKVTLAADGTVSGAYTGTWTVEEGTGYLTLKFGSTTYNGVIYEEQMDEKSVHAVSFSAMATSGVNVWGYKMHPKYAVAWQLNNQTLPLSSNMDVKKNLDLYGMDQGVDNVSLTWTTSAPDVISEYGRYNPTGLTEDTPVTLTARVESNDYYWAQEFQVKAASEANAEATADWKSGLLAHYGFDDAAMANTLNADEKAQLKRNATTVALPAIDEGDPLRNGNVMHISFGANGKESFVSMPNPLYGKTLDTGATISFWVKRTDNNLWDALLGLTNGDARLYMTGNGYVGFNNGTGSWLDINHPSTVETGYFPVGRWQLVTITIQRTATSTTGGVSIYVNGSRKTSDRFNGEMDGVAKTTKAAFDYNLIVDHLTASPELYLGNGSFWGSPDARFDDVMVYDRVLSLSEVLALNQMINRATDYSALTGGIELVMGDNNKVNHQVYDLSGRKVDVGNATSRSSLKKGLYIKDGKKFLVK